MEERSRERERESGLFMVTWTSGESHLASLDNGGILPVTFLYCALRNVMGIGNRSETKWETLQDSTLVWCHEGYSPPFPVFVLHIHFLNFNG